MLKAQLSRRYNEGSNPSKEPPWPATVSLLRAFFKPYSIALFRVLAEARLLCGPELSPRPSPEVGAKAKDAARAVDTGCAEAALGGASGGPGRAAIQGRFGAWELG